MSYCSDIIYQQLGGNRFAKLTGSKNFTFDKKSLTFAIIPNQSKATHITIEYNYNADDYTIHFIRYVRGRIIETVDGVIQTPNSRTVLVTRDGIYFDELLPTIQDITGIATTVPRIKGINV